MKLPPTTPNLIRKFVEDAEKITKEDPNDRNCWLTSEKGKDNNFRDNSIYSVLQKVLAFFE